MREGAAVILRPLTGYVPASCRPPSVQFVMFEAYHFAVPVPALQVSPKKMDLETALFGRARLESTPPPPAVLQRSMHLEEFQRCREWRAEKALRRRAIR